MPIGEHDPAQRGVLSDDLTRRDFLKLSGAGGIGFGVDQATAPFRSGAKVLGDGANFLMRFADLADKRDASLNAWLERFDGLPIEKESFTLFAEKAGRGNTYQLGLTVRDPSLIPDNDKPYTQISIHGVTKDQAKGIAQVFGGTKLTTVGETNLFDRLAKIGGGAGLGALAASVVARGMSKDERSKLIAEGAALGAGATALLGGLGVSTAIALLPEEKRRELFDSLLRSINEKLQPIFNIFNGSAGNLQSNEPTPISQAVTATFTPRPSPSATVTFAPIPTETGTPTPTVTAKPSETPTPTETPRPYEFASIGVPIFTDSFENPLLFDLHAGNPKRWDNFHKDGATVEIIPITSIFPDTSSPNRYDLDGTSVGNVLKVTINDKPVKHPDWGDPNLDWWAGYPFWANGNQRNIKLPCAVQVDLIKSPLLEASFLSVHRQKTGTYERRSIAGFEFGRNNTPKLVVTSPLLGERREEIDSENYRPGSWNRIRIEFRLVDDRLYAFPYINGRLALKRGQKPFELVHGGSSRYEDGFIDAHPGYQMGATQSGYRPKPDEYVLNRNFRVDTDFV